MPLSSQKVLAARAVTIQDEIARRGIQLIGRGPERAGPCPACGGRDRFAVNLRKHVWNCRGGGSGNDAISLTMHLDGVGFAEAVQFLVGELEAPRPRAPARAVNITPKDEDSEAGLRKLEKVKALVTRAGSMFSTVAEFYLRVVRRIDLDNAGHLLDPDILRFAPDVFHWPSQQRLPCIIAPIVGISSNELEGAHLTFLKPDGSGKADVAKPRLYYGSKSGGCVKLTADVDVCYGLAIAEGLETTLSAICAGYPAWACLDAGNLGAFPVLGGINCLTVFADHDDAGLNNARKVAASWRNSGREALIFPPATVGNDWNDEVTG